MPLIPQQFKDISQALKTHFYLHRVFRIHERLVNLRSDYNLRLKSAATTVQVARVIPPQESSIKVRPELDDVTLRYVQDLLEWVEENQRRIDEAEWGSDLPSVESQLGSHRGLHQTVEDFRSKIERAKADEVVPYHRERLFTVPSNITFLILKVTFNASCVFFRASYLLSVGESTENTWVDWTFNTPNYW